ncbi:MAG: sigma-70 family RNA polymerase sigma factor [Actinomycetota bacterium]
MSEPIVEERAETFEDFFVAHNERLLRAMYLATGDRHEAEDLAQEAFVRIFERWERVRSLDDPAGYLYRTALNARRSRLRRLAVAARKAVRPEPRPDEQDAAEDRTAVQRALAALPDGQREAVVLVEWLGMTDERAGEVLGVSAGAVRTRRHRARAALRDLLRGEIDA